MQNLCYDIGCWHADAVLEQVGSGKLMAVISLRNGNTGQGHSRHTIVFDHADGQDIGAAAERLIRRLVRECYGA